VGHSHRERRTVVVPSTSASIVPSSTSSPTTVSASSTAATNIRSAWHVAILLLRWMAVVLDGGTVGRPALLVDLPVEGLALPARAVAERLLLLDLLLALLECERCPFSLGQELGLHRVERSGRQPTAT
jgi:hypothetical protein